MYYPHIAKSIELLITSPGIIQDRLAMAIDEFGAERELFKSHDDQGIQYKNICEELTSKSPSIASTSEAIAMAKLMFWFYRRLSLPPAD